MRLNAWVARALGISRRAADELIKSGKVTLDGRRAGFSDNAEGRAVVVSGRPVASRELLHVAFNKPKGYITSKEAAQGKTIYEILPKDFHDLFPVGRLDRDTRGLLLLTNDGEWANNLLHPRFEIPKIYLVKLDRHPDIAEISKSIKLTDGISKFDRVMPRGKTAVEVELHEGRKRQIRRHFAALGYRIKDLVRIGVGDYRLGKLEEGATLVL